MNVPSLAELVVGHWHASWPLMAEAALTVAVYLWGTTRVRRGWPISRTLCFVAGVGCILVALESGLDSFDDQLLSAHMVQHLILLEVAPILLLCGQPARLALLATPHPARRPLGRTLTGAARWVPPIMGLFVFSVVVLATHVPAFYDATLTHPMLHQSEHALYLLSGFLLWWPLLGSDQAPARRLNGFLQLAYAVAAMVPMTIVGAYLSRLPTLLYPSYATPARRLGISAVVDQQHAGAIMWVVGGTLMVAVVLWTGVRAMVVEERRQQARDRHAQAVNSTDRVGEVPVP